MACRVCGAENAHYRIGKGQALCNLCNSDTPKKVSRSAFNAAYWKNDPSVPECTKREFYDDYLTSTYTLKQYIRETSFEVT